MRPKDCKKLRIRNVVRTWVSGRVPLVHVPYTLNLNEGPSPSPNDSL